MKNLLKYSFIKNLFTSAFIATIFSSGIVYAQPAEIPYHIEPYKLESGIYNGTNQSGNFVEVFSGIVSVYKIPWLSVHFSKANLGKDSYIIITSLKDGYWQKLEAKSLEQWNNFSAFFNGGAVEIKLFVAPFDKNIFINIDEVVVGEWEGTPPIESICGPTDDRIASNHLASGRLLNIGCTAWIIPNGKIVSAGHCLSSAGSVNVLEFNVPLSLPGGTIQHPPPEDQYAADVSSRVFINGGIGNDWGVFEVFPNSITGLMPKVAQNAYFSLVQDLGPVSIRITGFGVDDGTANQTQQTHLGLNWGSSGNTMKYRTDTQGGNSGSPVIDELTGFSTGVHTHGGCTSSGGNNNGTSLFNSSFWNAVDQGMGGCSGDVIANLLCPDVAPGISPTIGIEVDMTGMPAPDDLLGSFLATLDYDPSLIDFTGHSGLQSGFTGVVNVDEITGLITFNGANPTGMGGVVALLDIDFDVIGPVGNSSNLDLEFSAMAAALTFTDLLPCLTVNDCSFTIYTCKLGDINGDDLCNSTDGLIILSYDVGLTIPPDFLARINAGCCDINGDGFCNSTDVLILLSFDVGIPVPFPVCDPFAPGPAVTVYKESTRSIGN